MELASQKSPQAPPTGQQTALNMATLLQLAPTVAARMEWQREMVCSPNMFQTEAQCCDVPLRDQSGQPLAPALGCW